MADELPPELKRLAEFVDQQPPAVREAFQFCGAAAMGRKGAVMLVGTTQVDGCTCCSDEMSGGDVSLP